MSRVIALAVLLGLAGCHNACQDLCVKMKAYAEDECGLVVEDGDLEACLDAQAGAASRDDRSACRAYNSRGDIAEEWGCDELQDYFDAE